MPTSTTATAPKTGASTARTIPTQVQPYLFFNGRTEEAIEFYRRALGAEVVMLMRFKDSPTPPSADCAAQIPAGFENKVMHATIRIGATEVLLSDGCADQPPKFEGFSLSLTVAGAAEAERAFTALAAGGRIEMPLAKTFFSPSFGVLADRFGVRWMVYVTPQS
jgi:PhnB protein